MILSLGGSFALQMGGSESEILGGSASPGACSTGGLYL